MSTGNDAIDHVYMRIVLKSQKNLQILYETWTDCLAWFIAGLNVNGAFLLENGAFLLRKLGKANN